MNAHQRSINLQHTLHTIRLYSVIKGQATSEFNEWTKVSYSLLQSVNTILPYPLKAQSHVQ